MIGKALAQLWRAVRSRTVLVKSLKDEGAVALFGGTESAAGELVTADTMLSLSAVWAAVSLLSRTQASLPLFVYERTGPESRQKATAHPLHALLHEAPNEEMTAYTFRQVMQANVLLWGNSYAIIERDRAGRPLALVPQHPSRVMLQRDDAGRLVYIVLIEGGGQRAYPAENVLHFRGLSVDGLTGLSPVAYARETLGLAIGAEKFAARYFGNGARPCGLLVPPRPLSAEAARELQEAWRAWYGSENAHRLAVVQPGTTWIPLTMPLEDAQFLETRRFSVTEIARWFGVPPHMIGDLERATFSNIEHQGIEYVVYSLRPHLVSVEQELMHKLLSPAERGQYFIEHVVDGLLRGDITTRYNAYATAISHGFRCPDEVRALENLNPIPDGSGKVFTRPVNVAPVSANGDATDGETDGTGDGDSGAD